MAYMPFRFWRTLLVVTAWWTLYGVASTSQWLSMDDADGKVMPLRQAALLGFASAWLWIPFTMLLLWGVRRFPIEPGRLPSSILTTLALVVAIVAVRAAAVVLLNDMVGWYHQPPQYADVLLASFANNFLLLWLMVGAAHALLYASRARQRERQAEQLQAALVETRLAALTSQLNPHFMFNALNSIAEMVHRDPQAADRMLVGLGELLRSSLEHQASRLVPLRDELALLRHYLDIEKVRLGERLQLDWSVAEEATPALVPPLLLQPLAENAIVHALSLRISAGRLAIVAWTERDRLRIDVEDDGGHRESTMHHGSGLANLRGRLAHAYGDAGRFRLERNARGGTTASLDLPLVLQAARAAA